MQALTVTQLNRYVKALLEEDSHLQHVYVEGEVSNYRGQYASGHLYFSLKDSQSVLRAVMFRPAAQRLRFTLENGMQVLVRGRVSAYEAGGQYQLYVEDLQPLGAGGRALAYEQLKRKLEAEGLFAADRKKALPRWPLRVGVVTSASGAVVHDIQTVFARRWPMAKIVLCPVPVQGAQAAPQIARAIALCNEKRAADVLIVGRGGGSAEDLWAFNEEAVVRAVAASAIPVISAVGHETDVTLTDFAADLRAPTPSAAAEMAAPDGQALMDKLANLRAALPSMVNERLLDSQMQVDLLAQALREACGNPVEAKGRALERLASRLEDLSPLRVLARGYSVATNAAGAALVSARQVRVGERLHLRLHDGALHCTVDKIEEADHE